MYMYIHVDDHDDGRIDFIKYQIPIDKRGLDRLLYHNLEGLFKRLAYKYRRDEENGLLNRQISVMFTSESKLMDEHRVLDFFVLTHKPDTSLGITVYRENNPNSHTLIQELIDEPSIEFQEI